MSLRQHATLVTGITHTRWGHGSRENNNNSTSKHLILEMHCIDTSIASLTAGRYHTVHEYNINRKCPEHINISLDYTLALLGFHQSELMLLLQPCTSHQHQTPPNLRSIGSVQLFLLWPLTPQFSHLASFRGCRYYLDFH